VVDVYHKRDIIHTEYNFSKIQISESAHEMWRGLGDSRILNPTFQSAWNIGRGVEYNSFTAIDLGVQLLHSYRSSGARG